MAHTETVGNTVCEQPRLVIDLDGLNTMDGWLREAKIHDVVLVQNGEYLWEWYDQGTDRIAAVFSCTKSILSALIGMAIDDGLLSLEQTVSEFFDDVPEHKSDITIQHLLTMTAGMEWQNFDKPYFQMRKTDHWLHYILDQPQLHKPGNIFAYNSGCSHLLSGILTKVTGGSALHMAQERLFEPLGMEGGITWSHSAGISEGGTGLHITARDLARFGQLYLQEGNWEGKQLVSREWVKESTRIHHKGLTNYKPSIYGCYGWHWWCSSQEHNGKAECYFALGYGGQYLFVIPSCRLVAVIRKQVDGRKNAMRCKELLFEHILKIQS
ncbi:serine hydrolase domain-containing protein [Paenibacillus sp. GCM10012307]|uniref:Serine hydrolase n=1 Tax=Paenibacillus roseus TaxID=2798579 RepID=A0A934IZK3_9BACL|nr:serine hydrolase [Paenibacillus roseus]MBJ6360584.1 serine hydrolase [Paenibacillus roseus]